VSIFPNPATGEFSLRFNRETTGPVEVQMLNPDGQVVSEYRLESGSRVYSLPAENLAPGLYFVKIEADKNVYLQKLIIQP
jgi:hypothetical protein